MIFKEIDNLKRSIDDNLYDLSKITFTYLKSNVTENEYEVGFYEEMRMDLISNNIYGTTEYIDFLCQYNNIYNPLSIKEGNIIKYIDVNDIYKFTNETLNNIEIRKNISNKKKERNVDPNRMEYLDKLPPNITKKDYNAIKYKNGKIYIGENIFKN